MIPSAQDSIRKEGFARAMLGKAAQMAMGDLGNLMVMLNVSGIICCQQSIVDTDSSVPSRAGLSLCT